MRTLEDLCYEAGLAEVKLKRAEAEAEAWLEMADKYKDSLNELHFETVMALYHQAEEACKVWEGRLEARLQEIEEMREEA